MEAQRELSPSSQLTKLLPKLLRRLPSSSLGFVDQALISASNFLMMTFLARQLGPSDFGTFSLAFLGLMVVSNVQASLVTQPHNVLGATLSNDEYASYTYSTFVGQLWLALGVSAIMGVAATAFWLPGHIQEGRMLLAFSALSFTWQLQEFFKRTFYTRLEYGKAVAADLVSYVGQILAILLLWKLEALSVTSAMIGMAIVFACGAVLGALLAGIPRPHVIRDSYRSRDIVVNLRFGRWLLGAAVAYLIAGQLYPVLAAGFVSLAAMGGFRTAQNFVAPTNILNKTVSSIAPAQAARAFKEGGVGGLRSYLLRIGLPSLFSLGVFLTLVSIFAAPLVSLLVGDEYREYAWLVTFLSISYLLEFLATLGSVALRSIDEVQQIMLAECVSAVIVLTAGTVAVWQFGLAGAAAGLLVHGVVVNSMLWTALSNKFAEKSVKVAIEAA